MAETIFSKIIDGEMPADIVYEDDQCLAFRDINPGAPMHILAIPREGWETLVDVPEEANPVLGHLMQVACKVAEQEGYGDAFRVVVNNGSGAGQSVFHLHLHVLGGRRLKWPPG